MINFSELLDNRYADCRLGTILVKIMVVLAGNDDSDPENQKLTALC